MINTCALYAGVGGWLNINVIVLLATAAAIALVFMLGRFLPDRAKGRITGIIRSEISQLVISCIVLAALVGLSSTACSAVNAVATNLQQYPSATQYQAGPVPCPANIISIPPSDPFTYTETYLSTLGFGLGPSLASEIFSVSYDFGLDSAEATVRSQILNLIPTAGIQGPFGLSFPIGYNLGSAFSKVSADLLDVLLPLVLSSIAVADVQYIALIGIQALAFTILLPVALAMRSAAFMGPGLRVAANSLLALAIAAYMIYPMTVAFDHYALSWMFTQCSGGQGASTCNPSATYLCTSYNSGVNFNQIGNLVSTYWDQLNVPIIGNVGGVVINAGANYLFADASSSASAMTVLIVSVSEYLFTTVLMFVLNLLITVGFAMSLSRALSSGTEGAASFWSSI